MGGDDRGAGGSGSADGDGSSFALMVAACGRYLHQPINDVMDWDTDLFFLMFDQIAPLLKGEGA
jgi:hypothetical protein